METTFFSETKFFTNEYPELQAANSIFSAKTHRKQEKI